MQQRVWVGRRFGYTWTGIIGRVGLILCAGICSCWPGSEEHGTVSVPPAPAAKLSTQRVTPAKPALTKREEPKARGQPSRGDSPNSYDSGVKLIEVKPKGSYQQMDTDPSIAIMQRLGSREEKVRCEAMQEVLENANKYAPPALYALAGELFRLGRKEEAMFYFYLGQLRARSDANKCRDKTARQAVAVLNEMYGGPINLYAFGEPKKLETVVEKVVEWDRQNRREYDARWIALHGMGAFTEERVPFEPPERWAEIDEQTRREYLEEMRVTVKVFLEVMDSNGDGKVSEAERAAADTDRLMKRIDEEMKKLEEERASRGKEIDGSR